MSQTDLTAAQFAAFALTSLIEPLPRGFILASTAVDGMFAITGVDPDADYPADLGADKFSQLVGQKVMLTVVNESGLKAAVEDAQTVLRRLEGIDIIAIVFSSGEYLMEFKGEGPTTLEAATTATTAGDSRCRDSARWSWATRAASTSSRSAGFCSASACSKSVRAGIGA